MIHLRAGLVGLCGNVSSNVWQREMVSAFQTSSWVHISKGCGGYRRKEVNASWSGAEEEMLDFKVSVSPGLFLGFVF